MFSGEEKLFPFGMIVWWLYVVIAIFTNLKSFQNNVSTELSILWPVPPSILFPSYKIYYINFMCFYHLRSVVVAVACVGEKNKHIILPLFFAVGKYDALCMLTSLTLYCTLMKWHATRNVVYIYVLGEFKFIGFIKVVVWCHMM